MNSLEEYIEAAGRLAQEVVNAWGANANAGNAPLLTTQFKALLGAAFRYRDAKSLADNYHKHDVLNEREEAEEKNTRQQFAEAYKTFYDEHTPAS